MKILIIGVLAALFLGFNFTGFFALLVVIWLLVRGK